MKKIIILIGLLTITTFTYATTINIPTDYSTIQAGIDAAVNGDTVLVDTGTYVENINFNGKNITVASLFLTTQDTSYISQTVIDGNNNGQVVKFINGEDSVAVLSGFTIKNGDAHYGGGIHYNNSNTSLVNVTIINNSASYYGGGIYCYESSPSLESVTITNNSAGWYGGGIYCDYDSSPSLSNVTITNNSADPNGGGIYCRNSSSPSLVNTIVSSNTGNYGIYVSSGDPSIEYSNFYNNENGNFYNCNQLIGQNVTTNANGDSCDAYFNIQEDPLFVDPDNNNYHLIENSPCIDAGDPSLPLDPDGTIADMGAYYYFQEIVAHFTADTTSGFIPLTINFTDQTVAQDSVINWQWDFQNDGVIDSYQQNPTHTYNEAGTYSVKLIASTATLADTMLKNNYITAVFYIDGYVYLNNSNNHQGIEVIFERIAPSSLTYSTITNEDGHYETNVEPGIYEITFSKSGYYPHTLDALPLYANTTIQNATIYTYIPIPLYYSTIQEGINHCQDYDTVLVDTGVYLENINFTGKSITVASKFSTTRDTSYISQTIIDGDENGSVVRFDSGENSNALLTGFTIKNGDANEGGGIYCEDSDPSLEHLIIKGNTASDDGGGIYCDNSDPGIENVSIVNNEAGDYGAGVYCYYSSNPIFKNTIVGFNTGNYGIYVSSGDPSIMYCDFYDNENGNFYGCGDWVGVNVTTNVNGDSCDAYYNIQMDPCFVDTADDDYHLTSNSPCIDAGDPTFPLDPDGTIADMGAFYYNQGVGVDDEPQTIPENSFVGYPNPITAKTNKVSISFALKKSSRVNIKLYNIKGQLVDEILNDNKPSGTHTISSNINNLTSGIYFIKMDVDGKNRAVKKMAKIE